MSSGRERTYCDDSSSVAGSLDRFSEAAKGFIQPLQEFGRRWSALLTIKGELEGKGSNIGVDVDLQIVKVNEDLKVMLHEIGCKVEVYVSECTAMAKFVTEDESMDSVRKDLEAGVLVDNMNDYMKRCTKCLDRLKETETKFKDIQARARQWSTVAGRSQTNKVNVAYALGGTAMGAGGVAYIGMGFGIPVGITALATLFHIVLCWFYVVRRAAFGGAYAASAFAINVRITQQQKKVLNACEVVVKFYIALTGVQKATQSMEESMQAVAEYPVIKAQGHAKASFPNLSVMEDSLKSLRSAMKEVLSDIRLYPTMKERTQTEDV